MRRATRHAHSRVHSCEQLQLRRVPGSRIGIHIEGIAIRLRQKRAKTGTGRGLCGACEAGAFIASPRIFARSTRRRAQSLPSTVAMAQPQGASSGAGDGVGAGSGAVDVWGGPDGMSLGDWDEAAYAAMLDEQARAASDVLRGCCFSVDGQYLTAVSSFGSIITWEMNPVRAAAWLIPQA